MSNGTPMKRPYTADVVAAAFALGVFITASVFDVNGPRWLTLLGVAAIHSEEQHDETPRVYSDEWSVARLGANDLQGKTQPKEERE